MTNIAKDIFLFPTENIQRNSTWSREKADTEKTSSNFEKKIRILILDKFYEKSPSFMKFG